MANRNTDHHQSTSDSAFQNGSPANVQELSHWLNTVANSIEELAALRVSKNRKPNSDSSNCSDIEDDFASMSQYADEDVDEEEPRQTTFSPPKRNVVTRKPSKIQPDTVQITADLKKNIDKDPSKFNALFYMHGEATNAQPFNDIPNWINIHCKITELLNVHNLKSNKAVVQKLQEVVTAYTNVTEDVCDFGILYDDQVSSVLAKLLPTIAKQALSLPRRLGKSIPFMKEGENRTLYLTRNLACSLIANAMLCTISNANHIVGLNPEFNFFGLYNKENDTRNANLKKQKLLCFLEYFKHIENMPPSEGDSIISFERRCITTQNDWPNSATALSTVSVTSTGAIERADGMLQVIFANKNVGFGVLTRGCSQEETRFCISPELLCAVLFSDQLNNDEALVITGTKLFSSYLGYGPSFSFQPMKLNPWTQPVKKDYLGRDTVQVVAMDARNFKPTERLQQYEANEINRDLHKCFVAFFKGYHTTPVATGNWGCGFFNGDPELKFIIQWMGASVNSRPVSYYVPDEAFKQKIEYVRDLLVSNNITVDKLYNVVLHYHQTEIMNSTTRTPALPMFDYLDKVGVLFKKHKATKSKSSFSQCVLT